MRFLQLEWHNHERARNAWDIERAEMKAKIAKQEGEVRSAKRLNEQLEKHVKMLENALRNERAKSKAQAVGEKSSADQDKTDVKGKERASLDIKRKRTDLCPSRIGPQTNLYLQPRTSNTTPSSTSTPKRKSLPSRNGKPSATGRGSSSQNASRRSRTSCSHRLILRRRMLNTTPSQTRQVS